MGLKTMKKQTRPSKATMVCPGGPGVAAELRGGWPVSAAPPLGSTDTGQESTPWAGTGVQDTGVAGWAHGHGRRGNAQGEQT